MNRAVAIPLVLAIITVSAGCAPRSNSGPEPATPEMTNSATPESRWPYRPANMRIHPLTRLTRDAATDDQIIEARVEFTDADGITTRAVGRLELTLIEGASNATGTTIRQWATIDLRDREVNRQRFDEVTRTYLLKLELDLAQLPEEFKLNVGFDSDDGRRFAATYPLRRPEPEQEQEQEPEPDQENGG